MAMPGRSRTRNCEEDDSYDSVDHISPSREKKEKKRKEKESKKRKKEKFVTEAELEKAKMELVKVKTQEFLEEMKRKRFGTFRGSLPMVWNPRPAKLMSGISKS